jgi:ABC-type bacteriocin/lantibiotic exporter with double-glycine peptidase domain
MKHTHQIVKLVEDFAKASNHGIDHVELLKAKSRFQAPTSNDFSDFYEQLNNIGSFGHFNFEIRVASKSEFEKIVLKLTYPIIFFKAGENGIAPVLLKHFSKKSYEIVEYSDSDEVHKYLKSTEEIVLNAKTLNALKSDNGFNDEKFNDEAQTTSEKIVFITGFHVGSILNQNHIKNPTPFQRFLSLLKAEKRDIKYIYFFAILIAIINLTLPLGVQAIVGLISGGLLIESVVILILLVILATGLSGYLQIQQLKMVEILQQRVFANVTFEFAWRLPRIRIESLLKSYTPEMVNRFFDVLNIQKSLPKVLIDLTAALIQIIFGLLLLSLYHPVFIGFGFLILLIIIAIFYFTGKKALESSIYESKYKYKVAYWLQEIGRSINSFKLAGNAQLPVHKADNLLANYLKYRNKHFAILVKQFAAIVSFKTLITAFLLILGSFLVVNRQINLGQFVAAELIIVLIINSVEKLISTLEVCYDLLTALDKIGHVTDLQTENNAGRELHDLDIKNNFVLKATNLSYKYPTNKKDILSNVNFEIHKGQRVCVTGFADSGKTSFVKVLSGLYCNFEGALTLNNVSLRELNIDSYRSIIGDNLSQDDVFEGTIEENIVMGRTGISFKEITEALNKSCLTNFIANLSEGLQTVVNPGGTNFPKSVVQKILLARSFVQNPKLLIIDDFFYNMNQKESVELLNNIFDCKEWSVIIVSSQLSILKKCDKIWVLNNGTFTDNGTFEELSEKNVLGTFLN